MSIHFLDDESLLNVFFLYRPAILDGDEDDKIRFRGGRGWNRERWWYKLVHVCKRWRHLVLESTFFLGLCLVCTSGTPVADMLKHSPPLPLAIDYDDTDCDIAAEEGILLALEQRDRVRRFRLRIPAPNLQKITVGIDEYPVLEYLIMEPSTEDVNTALILPETLQTPHLRHLSLTGFALPIGSRLLTTAMGLATLALTLGHPSTYFQPNTLLRWLSFMPHLETLVISFLFPIPSRDVERQLMHMPIITHVTLPNLRWFVFRGISAYLEAVVRRTTTPRLEKLSLRFFNQLTFFVPSLLQLTNTTVNFRFDSAKVDFFGDGVCVKAYSRGADSEMCPFSIYVDSWCLDWQVSIVAQIFNSPSQIFSTVERLTLEHVVHSRSSEEHDEADRTVWRKFLKPFGNVSTLRVDEGLGKELLSSLRVGNGGLPLELLPKLKNLEFFKSAGLVGTSHLRHCILI